MLAWLKHSRILYIASNLIVLPAILIPSIDILSNFAFLVAFILLIRTNVLLLLAVCLILIIKNNSNYRFNLLLKLKGREPAKSDYECVYLYAWCTLLRYVLIGIAVNQAYSYFK